MLFTAKLDEKTRLLREDCLEAITVIKVDCMILSCHVRVPEWIHSIWPVCLNVWVFVYKISGCGFEYPLQSNKVLKMFYETTQKVCLSSTI